MSFELKNAGATYQRLVNKVFKSLIGKIREVYVDDMITKSSSISNHIHYLEQTFEQLKKYQIKLKPEKCSFRVSSRKCLCYMVNERGIEVNPQKIEAIVDMKLAKTFKEMQSLTGKLVAISRFISRFIDKCHKFFKVIRQGKTRV